MKVKVNESIVTNSFNEYFRNVITKMRYTAFGYDMFWREEARQNSILSNYVLIMRKHGILSSR